MIFDNSGQELTFYYEKGSDYISGEHVVKIYLDNYQIGSKSFTVK
jgi:hypothetical protein